MKTPRRPEGAPARAAAAAVFAGAWALGGCETLGQDFRELGEAIMPVTPSQAAHMMVDPHDADNRLKGTVAIAGSPFGGADPYLKLYRDRVMYETNALVKAASITALGRYGGPQDAPAIAACLAHESAVVRWEAAKALQRIHDPQVVPELLRALRNPEEDPSVRLATAIALGQYPQDRVFQGLVGALEAIELGVNEAARGSLDTITGQDLGLDPRRWLAWYAGRSDPFAGRREYRYPTFQRRESLLEKLAFWSSPTFEQPGTPAGLGDDSKRRTYPEDAEPVDHEAGG
jgi:hypothetical protein